MNNSSSVFSVKNSGFFLLLISIFFSFTNPNPKNQKSNPVSNLKNSLFNERLKNNSTPLKNKIAYSQFQNNSRINPAKNDSNLEHSFNADPEKFSFLHYNSIDNHEGVIGSQDLVNFNDDPSDNIYNINLLQYDKNKHYTLVYSVNGVNNSSSVTRSINRSFSLGGYISTKGNSWQEIKEDIDPALLNEGVNQILFNTVNANDYYLVKDVSIIESTKKRSSFYTLTSNLIVENKIYLKGFVNNSAEIRSVEIFGKDISVNKNEFEYFDSVQENQKEIKLKFIKKDGSFIEENVKKFDIGETASNSTFVKPEEKIISKDNFGFLLGLRTIDLPPLENSITNVSKNYTGYRYKSNAEGTKTIHLPYDKNKIPKGFKENDILTFGFDYQQKKWHRLKIDSIDTEKEIVVVTIEGGGDTDYVNGIIKNPESPETASFTPTTTNDVPVANPSSKINIISPPTANQQGSANVSYPIEIPAGINGFQPNISINYNSDVKNGGWLGVGWDIPVETIEIDTRWGVPAFDPNKESEIYTINGEQLVFNDNYLPNKIPSNLWENRVSGDKQFYFRTGIKEGAKITRKGTNAQNYTWEITDDEGTIKKYDVVLKDGSGNNVRWFLKTITNKYSHTITNEYSPSNDGNGGQNLYLSKITYSNNTVVEFINQSQSRPDATSSYKLGTKISENKLLDKIVVKRAGATIREYIFEYKEGRFEKKLLSVIIQKDGSGTEFNRHKFGYTEALAGDPHDNPQPFQGYKNITSPSDNLTSGSYDKAKMSLISGTQGKSENYKGAFTVGAGLGLSGNKKRTAGINYTYAENENFGKSQLMDMDGDGLPDKVFYRGSGSVQYRKNTGNSFSSNLSTVNGLNGIPLSKNNAYINSFGVEVSLKYVQGGVTFSTTKGNSPIYFSDVNGDGLPDLLYYGLPYFNKIRLNNGNATNYFSNVEANPLALTDTPNAILKGINAPITETPEEESNLLANIVRVWEAPTTGIINITNLISLEQNSTDGVDVWIEKGALTRANENSTNIPISTMLGTKITLNTQGQSQNLNVSNVSIEKGQRIYIVASSKKNPKGDKINIENSINYVSATGFSGNITNIKDTNGDDFFNFNAKNSYLKNTHKGNGISEKGNAKITWSNLAALTFSDDVNFKIYKHERKFSDTADFAISNSSSLIFYQKLKRGETLNKLASDENLIANVDIQNLPVNSSSTDTNPTLTFLYFEVSSDTNVAWDKINWAPKVAIATEDGDQEYKMGIQYKIYPEKVKIQSAPRTFDFGLRPNTRWYPKFTDCFDQSLNIPLQGIDNTEVTFSIKFTNYTKDGITYHPNYIIKKKVKITGNTMPIPYIDNYHDNNPSFTQALFEIHTDNYEVAKYLAGLNPNVEKIANNCFKEETSIKPNYYSKRSQSKNYNDTTGNMWQGWGGFTYNASKYLNQTLKEQEFPLAPVEEGDFPLPDCGDTTSPTYESCMLDYINTEQNKRYFTSLVLEQETESYSSPMESAMLDKNYMQPYNLLARKPSETFEGNPSFVTANPTGIISHSKGKSLNVYGGAGPFNISGGFSRDESSEHFQDFNGDQYPDIIVDNRYYKTDLTGALINPVIIGDKTIKNNTRNTNIGGAITKSINPEKNSNTQTSGANSWGELASHMGSSFSASGASVNAGLGNSTSKNNNIWFDINGDGLVDYISDGQVYINNGKDFVFESGWNVGDDVFKNETEAVSGGGGVNFGNGSWVAGVGKNFSYSRTKVFFIDVTGDGLVDKLVRNETNYDLYVNTGKSFSSNATYLGHVYFENENNQNSSGLNAYGTLCVAFGVKLCLSLGYGNDKSTNKQTIDLRDFNGDGLPDILFSTNDTEMTVIENHSGKFNLLSSIENPLAGNMYLTYSNTNLLTQQKIGNTYQMPTTKQALVKLSIDDSESTFNISDYNKSLPPSFKYYNFEYENGVQDRRERSFLGFGKVTTKDMTGITQVTEYETNFTNQADFYVPYNDTKVRKYFYKKGLVKSTYTLDSIGRQRQRVNYTYRYFDQIADSYTLTDAQTEPQFKDIGRIIPFLYKTESITTEFSGTSSHSKTVTSVINEYNKYGDVTKYTDLGSTVTNPADDLKVTIAYHPVTANNVGGIPQQHIVSNSGNIVLRKSETEISPKGEVTKIKRFIGSDFAEYKYEYDTYGNIAKSTFPKNQGETDADRMFYQYQFDPTYHTYITKVTDARGLSSSRTYDTNYLLGVPKTITDANGLIAYYTYDSFGRLTEFRSPADTSWTIKLHYSKNGVFNSNVAITEKKAPIVNGVTPTLNYFSSVHVSVWGEELATKKLYGGTANNYIYTYTKSPLKDIKGRVIKSFVNKLATQESGTITDAMKSFYPQSNQMINADEFKNYFVTYKYDDFDRPIKTTQNGVLTNTGPSDLVTQTIYGFDTDRDGKVQFTKKSISPKGITSLSFTDEKGRTTATKQIGNNKTLWTSYAYDILNQLTEVKDQNNKSTIYNYDQLGRRIAEIHPDAGSSTYQYDLNNNLISSDNAVLNDLNQKISYTYKLNRLIGITYPSYEVAYEYGSATATDYGKGRLIKITDHTGIQMFKYSKLGQVIENKRFMVAPNVAPKVFKTNFVYDTYNRINKITYPDSEEVFYNYTSFGLLNNIKSKAAGTTTQAPIVTNILYDYNEQTKEVTAGNGTKTKYTYDVWGRLQELALLGATTEIRKNQYVFDKDANISGITSLVPMNNLSVVNDISIGTEKTFEYDGFNRLKKSVIKATAKNEKKYYELEMAYTDMHGIANKNSRWKTFNNLQTTCQNPPAQGDKMVYSYGNQQHPNAVSSIEFNNPNSGAPFTTPWDCNGPTLVGNAVPTIKELYSYDLNGNMTKVEQEELNASELGTKPEKILKRQLFWDAQNRLKGINEGKALHHYVYDEDGQRALKSEGDARNMSVDGNVRPRPQPTIMGLYTYYPSGYMVANDKQVSKHYYIGSNKVAARVTETPSHGFLSPTNSELQGLSAALLYEAEELASLAGIPSIEWQNLIFDGGINLETEQICSDEVLAQADAFSTAGNPGCFKNIMRGYNTALLNNTVCEFWHNFKLDNCMITQPVEEQRYQTYWVHLDHLGSGSVITNQNGATTNWYEYMPFGEMLMEQSNNEYNNPFKYNGKELDEATGLYYYGARYFNPRTSIWLSVDPLAIYNPVMETEFYGDGQHNGGVFYSGNLNPYIYTYQNPIRYIDPNGKQTDIHSLINDAENWIHESDLGRKMYRKGNAISEEDQKEHLSYSPLAPMVITGELMENYNEDGKVRVQEIAEIIIFNRINKVTSKLGVHANSKTSKRAQHGYVIFDKIQKAFVKVGVSAGKEGKRMERQLRRWNKDLDVDRYVGAVVKKIEKGTKDARGKIYDWEGKVSRALENAGHLLDNKKHNRPRNK